ncbi:MAG: energy transducer TonB [Bacteroidales bacterium]|jgi:protein TonB|nr:energy transducer TonB [Bacteroidales bacterium]MDD3272586.1 energy transducer TonB [Bacteroidales bacterium]MDD4058179.1 energy transducer TonB [Bacteroidales bacterium]
MEIKKTPKADLESKKVLFTEIGLIVALALVLVAFEWKTYDKQIATLGDNNAVVIEEEMIPITNETPPPPAEVPKIPTVSDVIEIVDDDMKIENELIINTEDDKNLGVEIKDYVKGPVEEVIEEEEIPFTIVEEKPSFQGGDENTFTKWVASKLVYPEIAKENGVQGRVILQFLVGTDGSVSDVKVVRGVDASLDREAARVVASSPKWKPGRQRNKPVKVRYTFPVIFQLR